MSLHQDMSSSPVQPILQIMQAIVQTTHARQSWHNTHTIVQVSIQYRTGYKGSEILILISARVKIRILCLVHFFLCNIERIMFMDTWFGLLNVLVGISIIADSLSLFLDIDGHQFSQTL